VITLVENLAEMPDVGSAFSLERLNALTEQSIGRSLEEAIDIATTYASERLQHIGAGSARNVYAISDDLVLKIARNRNSIHQNAAEAKISKSTAANAPIARVIQRARPKSVWIVSQRATPFNNTSAFEEASDQTWLSFETAVRAGMGGKKTAEPRSKLVQATLNLVYDHGLDLPDVIDVKHWGVLHDGSIVLFDYGEVE